MALNKARTSVGMKIGIIILIIAFVLAFMAGGIASFVDLFQQNTASTATSTVDPVSAINQSKQPGVDALKQIAASNPTSYTAAVNVANAYFDWAQELSTPSQGQSQITTPAMEAAYATWAQAKAAYDAAAKLNKEFDPNVTTDRALATFYSNDATGAIELARGVVKKKPDFSPAWLNLGLFYDSTGAQAQAIDAYTRYLKLDPSGQAVTYASNRLKAFGASVPSTKTP